MTSRITEIEDVLRESAGGLSAVEIAALLSMSARSVREYLSIMEEMGRVRQAGRKSPTLVDIPQDLTEVWRRVA